MAVTVAELDQFIRETPEGVGVRRLRVGDRLYLEVRRPGSEPAKSSWVLRYSHAGKKQSLGLGRYFPQAQAGLPGRVKLADARDAAAAALAEIDKGIQPVKARRAAEKKAAADSNALATLESRTVRKAAEQWHDATKGELTSDKYRDQRWRRLSEYLDHIGDRPVVSLTVSDVAETIASLKVADKKAGKKGRRANRIETLRRSGSDLEKALSHARSIGWLKGDNPVTDALATIGKKPEPVPRRAIKPEQLPEFIRDVHKVCGRAPFPVAEYLLRLMVLTGGRTTEIRRLAWADVEGLDTESPMLNIPENRMKKRKAWSVPLSTQAVELLKEVKSWQATAGTGLKGAEAGFVFVRMGGNYKGRVCGDSAVNDLLRDMGWHGAMTGHGFRTVVSTAAHDGWPYLGANRTEAIEFSLAHSQKDKTRGTYDRNLYMKERRALLQWWANHLDLLAKESAGVVVPIGATQAAVAA